jgi:hypothetical protein
MFASEFTSQSALLFLAGHSAIALQGEALPFAVPLRIAECLEVRGGGLAFLTFKSTNNGLSKLQGRDGLLQSRSNLRAMTNA